MQDSLADPLDFDFDTSDSIDSDLENRSDDHPATGTYVTFDLGNQTFAADVSDVREILDMQPVSPLPNASRELLGMIDVRGEGLAVLDLMDRLGMQGSSDETTKRIIVLELGKEPRRPFGIVADHVRNVVEIPTDQIDRPPEVPGTWNSSALDGVTRLDGALVYLLSLGRLLNADQPGPFDFN